MKWRYNGWLQACVLLLMMLWSSSQAIASYVMLSDSITHSQVFPGTVHTFQVSVPDEYDGQHAACLYVGFDGVLCRAPEVIDSLMACGAMPPTIGVYVQPGIVRDSDGGVLRYNRSYEFDATNDRLACFLETELLPRVQTMITPDGRSLQLSPRPQDRMIFGLSSGGIAAMNVAWQRPDLFGKVFSGVGTFVAMRGGNDLQALVRKTEPLPLRIFLQDGTADAWNPLFGHWYEGNRMLASALDFAGYDVGYDWGEGGHNARRASQIFGQVMAWMWRDWPAELVRGKTHNDFLAQLLPDDDEGWIAHHNHEGQVMDCSQRPVTYPDGSLIAVPDQQRGVVWQYVVDASGNRIYGEPFYWLHRLDNEPLRLGPMAFDGSGNLWIVTSAGLQICDQNGRVRAILRLPLSARVSDILELYIFDGVVRLCTAVDSYERKFSVTTPKPDVRPTSQGQG